jgi:hypothetical protein
MYNNLCGMEQNKLNKTLSRCIKNVGPILLFPSREKPEAAQRRGIRSHPVGVIQHIRLSVKLTARFQYS